jgi:hypothetical protein
VNFTELRNEYLAVGIGEGIYDLVRELASSLCRRYPIYVYNGGLAWSDKTVDDLVQEVVLNHLLGEAQLDFIFDNATSVESVRRLLVSQIKRALIKRRPMTPIDRLLVRIRKLADEGVVVRVDGSEVLYHLPGTVPFAAEMTTEAQLRAVAEAASAPVLYSRVDSQRESQIFTKPTLVTVLQTFLEVHPCLTERQLRLLFENLLTPWTPVSLVPIEGQYELAENGMIEMATDLEDRIAAWTDELSEEECCVYYLRSRDVKDGAIAERIGKSRPTVINIKQRLFASARAQLFEGVDESLHLQVVYRAQELCALRLGESL